MSEDPLYEACRQYLVELNRFPGWYNKIANAFAEGWTGDEYEKPAPFGVNGFDEQLNCVTLEAWEAGKKARMLLGK